ncbi:MAG TPA: hypothetical protein VF773_21360 [Verrucomicrobiae bacterium]
MKLSDPRYLGQATENYNGSKKKKTDVGARIDLAIKGALEELTGLGEMAERRDAFMRLVVAVRERTEMQRASEGKGSVGWAAALFYIRRLQNVAARQAFWLRPLEGWAPKGAGARMQFRSLLEHLFVKYPVPAFMESAWDCEAGAEGFRQQSWYMRLARGASMRSLNLPNGLTRRMQYLTRHAPDHFTVLQALRYGEVRGLGGGEMLARAVAESALGKVAEHGEFWRSVIAFIVNHPELSSEEMNCMVEFIRATKFGGEEVLTETGKIKRGAPWPEFAMHGRTRKSILRVMREWGWEPAGKIGSGRG